MPKEISPSAAWKETISVPRDGEGIDAADVELPLADLLANAKFNRQTILELSQQLEDMKRNQGGFTIATPASLSVEPARSYPVTIGIGRWGGFAGAVDLDVQNLPAGVTASFAPDNTTENSSTLTLDVGAGAVAGTYDLFIVGTSGAVTASTKMQVTVAAASLPSRFDFSVPGNVAIDRASSGAATLSIDVSRQGGFAEPIQLSLENLPAGITAEWSANPVTGSASSQRGASVLTLTASAQALAGTYSVVVRAVSGTQVLTKAFSLTVTAAPVASQPDFSLSLVYDGGDPLTSNGATLYINRTGGYAGPVNISVAALDYGPNLLVDGQAWGRMNVTGNTARITANGAGRPYSRTDTTRQIAHAGVADIPMQGWPGSAINTYVLVWATVPTADGGFTEVRRTVPLTYGWYSK